MTTALSKIYSRHAIAVHTNAQIFQLFVCEQSMNACAKKIILEVISVKETNIIVDAQASTYEDAHIHLLRGARVVYELGECCLVRSVSP